MADGGSDFLSLRAAEMPTRGKSEWLADRLRVAITGGTLAAGTVLPPTRSWAAELGVSRGVVVEACGRLADEGLLTGRAGSGTAVADLLQAPRTATASPPVPAAAADLDLSPGLPDLAAFPRAAWLRAERAVLREVSTRELGYGHPQGHPVLRAELAARLARLRGVRTDPDGIVVVSGVAQALGVLARSSPHGLGRMAFEDPGSAGVRDHLVSWGAEVVPVGVDEDGLDVAALAGTGADAVLVTPAHQFPTGVVLSRERRRALVAWAAAGNRLIVEDDYDAEHRYDRAPVAAVQPSAPDLVAYTGSVSKTLAPALRLGWLVVPPRLLPGVVAAKHDFDIASATVPQLVLAALLADGTLDRHTRSVRIRQRARRDALVAGLRQHVPQGRVHGVAAGLHLLVTLPGLDDDVALAERIAEFGVTVHPLSRHRTGDGPAGLVIGYAAVPVGRLTDAARRIGTAVTASVG